MNQTLKLYFLFKFEKCKEFRRKIVDEGQTCPKNFLKIPRSFCQAQVQVRSRSGPTSGPKGPGLRTRTKDLDLG